MIKFLLPLLLAFACSLSGATEKQPIPTMKDPAALLQTEISRLDTLIFYTQKSLDEQKRLKNLIEEYKAIQEEYLKKTQDNDLLLKMVKSAHRTLKAINEYHLAQTFDPEFIEELTVLSLPTKGRKASKPKPSTTAATP